ncbi:MAG: hypothetical protein ABFQ89_04280 [Chloroflexota bacterium]
MPDTTEKRDNPSRITRSELKRMTLGVLVELVLYALLVVVYAALAFRTLSGPLLELFSNNLALYSAIALTLIIGQGLLLEEVTSFLLDRLRLERFD